MTRPARAGAPDVATELAAVTLRPVRAGDAFEATVEHLATAIRVGVFPRGESLPPERELAARLGVARATLREAIAALRDAGMVSTRRGRGGGSVVEFDGGDRVVTRPDHGEAAEPATPRGVDLAGLLDFRRVVEPGAARLAASRALDAPQRAFLTETLREVTAASSRDVSEHRVADSRFHIAIAGLSGSAPLIDAVTRCRGTLHRLLAEIPVLAPNIDHSNVEHAAIVEAILGGEPDEARRIAEQHCDNTSALLRALLP